MAKHGIFPHAKVQLLLLRKMHIPYQVLDINQVKGYKEQGELCTSTICIITQDISKER